MKTSELFSQHQILFRAPIIRDKGWEVGHEDTRWTVGGADVIDLNKSGRAESHGEDVGFFRTAFVYDEPVLTDGLKNLQALAEQTGTEIITDREYPFARVQEGGVNLGNTMLQRDEIIARHPRPIASLVAEVFPQECGARWAIDPVNKEFLIFK